MRGLRPLLSVALVIAVLLAGFSIWRAALRHPPVAPAAQTGAGPGTDIYTPVAQQTLQHGRFRRLAIYDPHAAPRGFVLLLSGTDGWTLTMADLALKLAARGALVVGIDITELDASLEADGAGCVFPDGDLENLSHFVQAYFRVPTYLRPLVAGHGAGAALAYAMLAQAPVDTFAGAISIGFCPVYPLTKPLCKGSGLDSRPNPRGTGVEFLPSKQIGNPWQVIGTPTAPAAAPEHSAACDAATMRAFVDTVPGAAWLANSVNGSASNSAAASPATPAVIAAFDAMLSKSAPAPLVGGALADLPLIEIPALPAANPSDTLAIMLSGDGGWAGLDKEVAAALSADGIPVVGLDSLRYFWSSRTPAGLAGDLDRIIAHFVPQFGRRRVMLIGYSQGADVLPFAVNRLAPASRSHLSLVAVMGMSEHALFEFHLSSWVADDNSGPATLPEVEHISGTKVLCIYGDQESDSLCPRLDPRKVSIVKLKGGHHFDGDYAGLARAILASAAP